MPTFRKPQLKAAFDSALDGIKKGLKKRNSKVTLVGFGTFKNVYRKTRMGFNPQTGEKIKIKGSKRGNIQAEQEPSIANRHFAIQCGP
jgi:nucleoid DNA-binding protein